MDILIFNDNLLDTLYREASTSERLRFGLDLRTTPEDESQRLLNVMEPGTHVPIHRHMKTSETAICIEGCLDWIFYQELPTVNAGGPVHDGEHVIDETCFKETARFRICPRERKYGIQVPPMTWHSVEVHEPSTIFEAKDGRYEK